VEHVVAKQFGLDDVVIQASVQLAIEKGSITGERARSTATSPNLRPMQELS
jgi:hypothetical protein